MNRNPFEDRIGHLGGAARKPSERSIHKLHASEDSEGSRISGRHRAIHGIRQKEAQHQIREFKSRY